MRSAFDFSFSCNLPLLAAVPAVFPVSGFFSSSESQSNVCSLGMSKLTLLLLCLPLLVLRSWFLRAAPEGQGSVEIFLERFPLIALSVPSPPPDNDRIGVDERVRLPGFRFRTLQAHVTLCR